MVFTVPYYITQPSTDDTVQIVPSTATTNFRLTCTLNVNIPAGMTVTWSHNGDVQTIPNTVNANTNTTQQTINRLQTGVYQCAFNYITGYIVRRNITVLGMCNIMHS